MRNSPPHPRNGHAKLICNLAERLALAAKRNHPFSINAGARSSDSLPDGAGVGNSSAHSLRNQVPLKLCHCSHNVEEELTAWSGGIDTFGVADEIDAESVEFIQAIDEVFHRPRESIELPNQNHVEAPLARIVYQGVELRATTLGSTDAHVDVLMHLSETLGCVTAEVI